METVRIYEDDLQSVIQIAERNDCSVKIVPSSAFKRNTGAITVLIKIEAKQDPGSKLLAYAEKAGVLMSFVDAFQFTAGVDKINFKQCDRCKTAHDRSKVFFVETDRRVLQVGGHCAEELNCETRAKKLVKSISKTIQNIAGYSYGSGGTAFYDDSQIQEILMLSLGSMRRDGYITKKYAENHGLEGAVSTASMISMLLNPSMRADFDIDAAKQEYINMLSDEEKIRNWAEYLIEFFEKQDFSEFQTNCITALKYGKSKMFAFLVAAIGAFHMSEVKKAKDAMPKIQYTAPSLGKVELKNALVHKIVNPFGYNKITVLDPTYGYIYFATNSQFSQDLVKGDKISGIVTITVVKENISFAKRPHKMIVEKI